MTNTLLPRLWRHEYANKSRQSSRRWTHQGCTGSSASNALLVLYGETRRTEMTAETPLDPAALKASGWKQLAELADQIAAAKLVAANEEIDRLRNALNRRNEPPSDQDLAAIWEKVVRGRSHRAWRTAEYLLRKLEAERDSHQNCDKVLRAQINGLHMGILRAIDEWEQYGVDGLGGVFARLDALVNGGGSDDR